MSPDGPEGQGTDLRVLVIDNYDSFTYNLVHAFAGAGADVVVARNDAISRDDVAALDVDAIVLSPGPGSPDDPRDFGVCADLIRDPVGMEDGGRGTPMLGVCLGMQGMAHHTGGRVIPAPEVVHGESSRFEVVPHPLFDGLAADGSLEVGRYHSLCVDPATLPAEWEALGSTADGILMAMRHRGLPWIGVQFHPESILTPDGPRMVHNFLRFATT